IHAHRSRACRRDCSRPWTLSICSRCSVCHWHLHSFPTRRSSDLVTGPSSSRRPHAMDGCARAPDLGEQRRQGLHHRTRTRDPLRSEEHTSELQSRENLVCRLLLEKKQKRKMNICCTYFFCLLIRI